MASRLTWTSEPDFLEASSPGPSRTVRDLSSYFRLTRGS
jgi:hypothetical protein